MFFIPKTSNCMTYEEPPQNDHSDKEEKVYEITIRRVLIDDEGRPRKRNHVLTTTTEECETRSDRGMYYEEDAAHTARRLIDNPDQVTGLVDHRIAMKEAKNREGKIEFEVEEVESPDL